MNTPTSSIIELRQYTLHPGRRDELIELFEREFIEPQAAVGLRVLGIFGDAERPDRFVWFRGFADMAGRGAGLAAFYGGAVWQAHRDAANATMMASDDVLLLRLLTPWPAIAAGLWFTTLCLLHEAPDDALRDALRTTGGCWLETEPAENNFPRLPVRNEWAVVALSPQPAVLPEALLRRLRTPPQVLHLQPTSRSPLR